MALDIKLLILSNKLYLILNFVERKNSNSLEDPTNACGGVLSESCLNHEGGSMGFPARLLQSITSLTS
jgi:hypothetical protein